MTDLRTLQRRARYGHKAQVYWWDGSEFNYRPFTRDGIKAAILAVRGRGRWYYIDTSGCSHVVKSLRMGLLLWRNATNLHL